MFEPCERSHCGGWMKEIVNFKDEIEKICGKCARSPDMRYKKKIEEGKLRHAEFNMLFRAIWKKRARKYRIQKQFIKEVKI